MMRKSITCAALLTLASVVGATENGAKLSWNDGWGWGGINFSAPRVIYLEPLPKGKNGISRGQGGVLEAGNSGRPIRLRSNGGKSPLSVETFGFSRPGLTLKANAGGPLAPGASGIITKMPLWISDNGQRLPKERSLALWRGSSQGEVLAAWRGFLQGQLKVGDTWRMACVADGDGNGLFGDASNDQLWIDLNGDKQLDVATEQFAVAPLLRIEGQVYSFFVSPSGAAIWRAVEGGTGKARLAFVPKSGEVKDISTTLVAQTGEPIAARAMEQDVELPTGRYQVLSLSLRLAGAAQREWSYAFARDFDRKSSYPFRVDKTATAQIQPFHHLNFSIKSAATAQAGATLKVELNASSDTGLQLTNAATGERSYDREDYAKIELRDAQGKVLANAGSGFA